MKYHISEPQAEICGDSINRGIAHSLEMSVFVSGSPDSFNLLKSSKTWNAFFLSFIHTFSESSLIW